MPMLSLKLTYSSSKFPQTKTVKDALGVDSFPAQTILWSGILTFGENKLSISLNLLFDHESDL